MPIKQKKSSRDSGNSKDRPGWDDQSGPVPGESADARIRRMSMQMASAERSGFRGERSDLYGGLPIAVVWAIRIAAAAAVVGGIFAVTSLFRSGKPQEENAASAGEDAIAALIRAAGENPEKAASPEAGKTNDGGILWLSVDDESFAPYRETILSFFEASTPDERRPFVIPSPDVEKSLEDSANNALFDQIAAPTFTNNYCTGEGWMTVDVLLPSFGFRPIIIDTTDGQNLIDLDAFLALNPKTPDEIREDLENGHEVTMRTLAALAAGDAGSPGDLLVVLHDPNDTLLLNKPIIALLSQFGAAPDFIIGWLAEGRPLPFTVTVMQELSLTGETAIRISEIRADAWSSGLTSSPVALAPSSKKEDGAE